jgi:hypothetical protein
MKFKTLAVGFFLTLFLSGCGSTPTKPNISYSSENSIAFTYHAYGMLPTVSAEAIDMAIEHCKKHGKGMKLISSNASNALTTEEIHTFMCTNDFVDERIEVNVKN